MTDRNPTIHTRVPADVLEELKAFALAEDRSVNATVVRFIRAGLASPRSAGAPA